MNIGNAMEEKLAPIAGKMANNKILTAVRNGLTLSMPLIIAGSIFMIIASFPIAGWGDYLGEIGVAKYLWKGVDSSFGLVALIAAFGVAQSYSTQHDIDGLASGVISLSSFITVTPFIATKDAAGMPTKYMAANGIFVALIIALTSATIYNYFVKHNITIKLPDSVPPAVARSFIGIIPGVVIISFWLAVFASLERLGLPNMHELVGAIIATPLKSLTNNLFGVLIVAGLNSLFWFVGVHGAVVHTFFEPIWLSNLNANVEAFQKGQELPNIVTTPFMMNFVYLGGGGATLGLVLVLAYIARRKNASKQAKALAPITLVPGMFNINEPTLFGIPVVLNFSLLIPFVLVPMVNGVITYSAMATGLCPKTMTYAPWTMPPILSGFFVTGSIMGAILQIILIVIDVLMFMPFVFATEKQFKALEEKD